MTEEQEAPQVDSSTETAIEIPTDFREYDRWRRTGELPAKPETPQPATAQPGNDAQVKTEPQSGADATTVEDDEDDDKELGQKRPGSRQRRIDRLTRENEELRRQLAQGPSKPAETAKPEPPAPPDKPKLANYKTLEEYQEALTDWKLDQREKAQATKTAQETAQAQEKKLQTEWESRQQTARTAHPDYDDIIQSVAAPEGPGVLAARQAMLEDDAGPEILYYLATHPDEMKRIAALLPNAAVREIGKLSVKLAAPPSDTTGKQKPKVSGAPKPPPAITRPARTATDSVLDEDLARTDYKKWERLRVDQLKDK